MAWTAPRTWNNEVVDASDFNVELRDNQLALKDPPSGNYESNEASNYTTSSSSYVDVDSDYSFTLQTTGGDVLVAFMGTCVSAGSRGALISVLVDGVTIYEGVGTFNSTLSPTPHSVAFTRIITGLAAGSHTFKLQWKEAGLGGITQTIYAGAGTPNYDLHPQFWARELT